MKHKHAELMLEYAQDAMQSETPWDNWEYSINDIDWFQMGGGASAWHPTFSYRRKKKTININGYEVSEPIAEYPMIGSSYYLVSTSYGVSCHKWSGGDTDVEWWENGLIHANKEDAELHLKALLSFTNK